MKQPLICGILASLALTFGISPDEVKAQDDDPPTASFVIRNTSNVVIKYQVKWGNGDWVSHHLDPGTKTAHSYPLDFQRQAPTPSIHFDGVGNGWKEYKLTYAPVWASKVFHGKPYVFRYDATGRFLDAYSE